ncbi:MAG: hypothetical protein KIS73_05125 [Enhydrobacter sp.]|nr:hypothetical protein [Enhydrobacter sp.]
MRDLHNNIYPKRGLSPVAAGTDNTAMVSQIVDRQGFDSVEFVMMIGANTDADATFAVLFEESDDSGMSGANAVADSDLLGTEAQAGFTFDDDNECRKIGYVGNKRYCRVTVTPTGNNSGNIFLAALWILGHPNSRPTANPPAS